MHMKNRKKARINLSALILAGAMMLGACGAPASESGGAATGSGSPAPGSSAPASESRAPAPESSVAASESGSASSPSAPETAPPATEGNAVNPENTYPITEELSELHVWTIEEKSFPSFMCGPLKT
jgi:hypothetical protein